MKNRNRDTVGILFFIAFALFLFLGAIELYSVFALGNSFSKSRTAFIGLSALVFLAAAALPWTMIRGAIRYVIFLALIVETSLQTLALVGLLPGVSMSSWYPFARTYWTKEGFSNSIRNRYGWHAPQFRFRDGAKRVAIIGDSFVEGRQVNPKHTIAVRLQSHLEARLPGRYDFIGLGQMGAGPAQYHEFVRYARDYFAIDEVVLMVYVGNDFKNLVAHRDRQNIAGRLSNKGYYTLDERGEAVLTPGERERIFSRWRRFLDRNHKPLLLELPRVIRAQLMTPSVVDSIITAGKRAGEHQQAVNKHGAIVEQMAAQLKYSGLDGFIFKEPSSSDAEMAFTIAEKVFSDVKSYCDSNGIVMKVVSIPHAPSGWFKYVEQNGFTWKVESWDFSKPERRMRGIFGKLQIPYLETGLEIRELGIDIETLKSTRFFGGSGHLTEVGHDFYARLIHDRFYQ